MITWQKYDQRNPPEPNRTYLVTDGRYVDIAYLQAIFDKTVWCPPDKCSVDELLITHYSEINLPT